MSWRDAVPLLRAHKVGCRSSVCPFHLPVKLAIERKLVHSNHPVSQTCLPDDRRLTN